MNPRNVVSQLRRVLGGQLPDDLNRYPPLCREVGSDYLHWMLDQIESGQITGEDAHRWIGWIEGVLVARGLSTVEQMEAINAESGPSAARTVNWVLMAYAKLGVVRDSMTPEAVEIIQNFLGPID